MAEPTVQELQQQLVTIRERLREVEGIAFRPIHITVNFPGWPNPRAWLATWRKGRTERLTKRHHAQALRKWRRLCRKAQRDPRSVTSAELDRAWAAVNGQDGWKPPQRLLFRLRLWWAEREERRAIERLRRLMAKAKPEDVARENAVSLARFERFQKRKRAEHPWYFTSQQGAFDMGRKAIEWARHKNFDSPRPGHGAQGDPATAFPVFGCHETARRGPSS